MRNNIVLIDFENVQPQSLDHLEQDHFRVLVFVGANQKKLPFEVAASLQRMGSRAEYIKICGNGSNALDFHIAYYIGALSAAEPSAYFHVVSRDTGFDPLIQHLKSRKVLAGRVKEIGEIPLVRAAGTKSSKERGRVVLERLSLPKATKPRTLKTLSSAIASMFQKQISDDDVASIVKELENAGFIRIDGTKIGYPGATV